MAKQLRALVVLGKNPCLIPSTHMGAYNCLSNVFFRALQASIGIYMIYTQACRKNTHAHKEVKL